MFRKAIFITSLLTIITICSGFGQSSLKLKKLSAYKYDTLEIYDLLDSAEVYLINYPIIAFSKIEKAFELSIKYSNKSTEALCYYYLGRINYNLSQNDLAIENYLKSIKIFEYLSDENGLYNNYKNVGIAYEADRNYNESIKWYKKSLKEAEKRNNIDGITSAKNLLANVHQGIGNEDLALSIYNEVLVMEKNRNNQQGIILSNNNIGDILLQQEKSGEALNYFYSSQSIAEQVNDSISIASSLNNISKVFRQEKKYAEELLTRVKLLDINKKRGDYEAQSINNLEIGNIYIEENKPEEAIQYFEESIELSDKTGNFDNKKEALQKLYITQEKSGNYKDALSSLKEYIATLELKYEQYKEEVEASLKLTSILTNKQKRIDLLEKNKEINDQTIELLKQGQDLQIKSLKLQRTIIYSLSGGFLLLLIISILIYRSSRQKRIANMLLALKSLRSQMNPHFIFNALNSVNSFIAKSDEKSANKYLSDFSKLMRLVMENSEYDFVSLDTEINTLELYLSLEHFRFKEKFDYTFNVGADIATDTFEIPPMFIQPYIENAIWHGLRYKEDKGFLNVIFEKDNQNLKVIVEDNGIGRKESKILKTKFQKENVSTGLKNIENRVDIINKIYKTKISVNIIDFDIEKQSGTTVTLIIPPISQ